jgi:asparagine synthase (glutamine-hydrolysing)
LSAPTSEWARLAYFSVMGSFNPVVRAGAFNMFSRKALTKLLKKPLSEKLKNFDEKQIIESVLIEANGTELSRVQVMYLRTYLQTLLIQEDKVSMAFSLESRIPLCDADMLDFSLEQPFSQKLYNGELKHFVRSGMRGILPDLLYFAPKRGFPVPLALWFRGPLKKWVQERILGEESALNDYFQKEALEKRLNAFFKGKGEGLWHYAEANRWHSLLFFEAWLRLFLKEEVPSKTFL